MKINPLPQGLAEKETYLRPEEKAQMEKVSQQFESIFVDQMVGQMRKTIQKSGYVKESQAERVFQSMLDSEYSQKISESDQMGLAGLIYRHLLENK